MSESETIGMLEPAMAVISTEMYEALPVNRRENFGGRQFAEARLPGERETAPPFRGVPSMIGSLRVEVPWLFRSRNNLGQPDGGEVVAKRKGVVARRGVKEAWSKGASRRTRTGYEAYGSGRVGQRRRSPNPSKVPDVNPAVVRRHMSNLHRQICGLSRTPD